MIQACELTKTYEDGTRAVTGLTFAVQPGELFCMLGANGAGKTTTLNLFMDFIRPTSGQALVNGIDVNRESLLAKQHISYVSENVMLYGNLSALQNLAFFASLGKPARISRDVCRSMLAKVGLQQEFVDQPLRKFSKGMRQKLGLAIALARDATAILLDEPTSGLDPRSGADFMRLLSVLRSEGRAILMSTHDILRTAKYADTVGIMREGLLVRTVSRAELGPSELEELYLQHFREQAE